jgi:hypothetical protein
MFPYYCSSDAEPQLIMQSREDVLRLLTKLEFLEGQPSFLYDLMLNKKSLLDCSIYPL